MYDFHQLISDLTHILPASSYCIDLIFIDQPKLVVNSGIHPSIHANRHDQITYGNLKEEMCNTELILKVHVYSKIISEFELTYRDS